LQQVSLLNTSFFNVLYDEQNKTAPARTHTYFINGGFAVKVML